MDGPSRTTNLSIFKDKVLLLILLAGIVPRLILFTVVLRFPDRAYYSDSTGYVNLAINFLQGKGFYYIKDSKIFPEAERTIAYPLFISGIYSVCGQNPQMVILIQNIIDMMNLFFIFLIGKMLVGRKCGLICGFLYAIDPVPIIQTQFLLNEPLFTFFIISGLYLLLRAFYERSIVYLMIGVALWGISLHIRPLGSWFLFVLISSLLILEWSRMWSRLIPILILISATLLLILLPWAIRNYRTFGTFFFSTNSKKAFIAAHIIPTLAHCKNKSPEEIELELRLDVLREYASGVLPIKGKVSFFEYPTKDNANLAGTNPYLVNLFFKVGLRKLLNYKRHYALELAMNGVRMAFFPGSGRNEYITQLLGITQIPVIKIRTDIKRLLVQGKLLDAAASFLNARVLILSNSARVLWLWIFFFEAFLSFFGLMAVFHIYRAPYDFFIKFYCFMSFLTVLYFFLAPGLEADPRYRLPVEPMLCILSGILLNDQKTFSAVSPTQLKSLFA